MTDKTSPSIFSPVALDFHLPWITMTWMTENFHRHLARHFRMKKAEEVSQSLQVSLTKSNCPWAIGHTHFNFHTPSLYNSFDNSYSLSLTLATEQLDMGFEKNNMKNGGKQVKRDKKRLESKKQNKKKNKTKSKNSDGERQQADSEKKLKQTARKREMKGSER